MLSRLRKPVSQALLVGVRNSSVYKPPASWIPPHYDELPVPQGSWQVANQLKQRKRNMHLFAGIALFLFTLSVVRSSGLIFFNWAPPPYPPGASEDDDGGACQVVVKKC